MMLASGQLSTLTEMGIPVWELRLQNVESSIVSIESEFIEPLPAVDYLIVLAQQDHNDEAIRLLHAMLFSIDIPLDNSAIVSANQLEQLSTSRTQHKVLIVFGEQLVSPFLDSQTKDHEQHSLIKVIVSPSLTMLLSSPTKKALAWQELQTLKMISQVNVIQQ